MSWTPKVGDQVIYNGETMEVVEPPTGMFDRTLVRSDDLLMWMTRASWLTPAPYPEPDEPTAPGALVRDGAGRYLTRGGMAAGRWYGPNVQGYTWDFIQRPVTVVLADPAEVETLRDEVKAWCHAEALRAKQRDEAQSERDELQRRIGTATAYAYGQQAKGEFISSSRLDSILRGES